MLHPLGLFHAFFSGELRKQWIFGRRFLFVFAHEIHLRFQRAQKEMKSFRKIGIRILSGHIQQRIAFFWMQFLQECVICDMMMPSGAE